MQREAVGEMVKQSQALLRNMKGGEQENVPWDALAERLLSRLPDQMCREK